MRSAFLVFDLVGRNASLQSEGNARGFIAPVLNDGKELGSAHETEKIVRLGLPRIIRLKENAPELDYSSFYGKTGTGRPTAL